MITLQWLTVALLIWVVWMLHYGLKVTIHMPDAPLRQDGTLAPVHQRMLVFWLCDAKGRLKTEITTYKYQEPPPEFEYAGVSYISHRISKTGNSVEYRPKVTK